MKLKIISFNIRNCDDPNGHSVAERAPRLESLLKKYDADIIGLQEYTPRWEKYFTEQFSDISENYEIFNKYRSSESPESSPILWKKEKFDCLKKGWFWLSDTPEVESKGWDELYDCHRICEYAVLVHKESGKKFAFMNTHYGFGDECQRKSGELIYKYSEKISELPTVLIGDFNMTPESSGYKTVTKYFSDVNALTTNDLSPTFHNYGNGSASHIDYCFVNGNIKPVSQKLMNETFGRKFPSDHYGIYMSLEIL